MDKPDVKLTYTEKLYLEGLLSLQIKKENLKIGDPGYEFIDDIMTKLPYLVETKD